jgi:hypothetical protein
MIDQQHNVMGGVDAMTDEQRVAAEAEEVARRERNARNAMIDKDPAGMGGAGAQGGIPADVSKIDQPAIKP